MTTSLFPVVAFANIRSARDAKAIRRDDARDRTGPARRGNGLAEGGRIPVDARRWRICTTSIRRPTPQRVSILHNELKFDNSQFQAPDPDRVTSIFDWDMANLGDPLIDLGTLLGYSSEDTDPAPRARDPPNLEAAQTRTEPLRGPPAPPPIPPRLHASMKAAFGIPVHCWMPKSSVMRVFMSGLCCHGEWSSTPLSLSTTGPPQASRRNHVKQEWFATQSRARITCTAPSACSAKPASQ